MTCNSYYFWKALFKLKFPLIVPKLQVTIGNYTLVDSFYVVDVADTNVVLGVQWLYSIGEHSVNY